MNCTLTPRASHSHDPPRLCDVLVACHLNAILPHIVTTPHVMLMVQPVMLRPVTLKGNMWCVRERRPHALASSRA